MVKARFTLTMQSEQAIQDTTLATPRAQTERNSEGFSLSVLRPASSPDWQHSQGYGQAANQHRTSRRPESRYLPDTLWRDHSDAVNLALCERWLPGAPILRLLKTDLFDEAVGHGLYYQLAARSPTVIGMDVATTTLDVAHTKYPGLLVTGADVRHLPFAEGAFNVVVSNSTLDHLESPDEIKDSLQELNRVLCSGGHLLLTLDNPANPVVALRNVLPFWLLHWLRLVPYQIGVTVDRHRLVSILQQAGFEVHQTTAVMHCPRVIAVATARMVQRHSTTKSHRRFLRALMRFERLEKWPMRFLTGHFVAVNAIKR